MPELQPDYTLSRQDILNYIVNISLELPLSKGFSLRSDFFNYIRHVRGNYH